MKGIQKLKSGRYQARYFSGYDTKGNRVYPSKTFRTQGDALKWRNARIHEKDTGQLLEGTTLTLSAYMDQWFKGKLPELQPNSQKYYEYTIENYIKPELGKLKLANLRPMHFEQWQNHLLVTLTPQSVGIARAILNVAMAKAVRLKLVHDNPLSHTDAPKKVRREMKVLSPEDAAMFLSFCASSKFGLFFKCSLKTGLRPEEMIGLKWSRLQLDGKRGSCHVREVIVRPKGGGWLWGKPKSRSGVRTITLPGSLVAELREHHRRQLEERMKAGPHYQQHDLVFAMPSGAPWGHAFIVKEFKAVLKSCGLPSALRLYDLRHSFVTISLLAGVDMKTVSYEAGHASVAFTLDVYGHVLKEMHEAASDKRERFFDGAVKRYARGSE